MKELKFSRSINLKIFDTLRTEHLYQEHLKSDIDEGKVFPAIRKDRIDFYYKGGKLFSYNNAFSTHIKYASVIKTDKKLEYITEKDLKTNSRIITNFHEEYSRIKENCSLYSGDEDLGISSIYHKYSITNNESDIVVLDIEIAFEPKEDVEKKNRIDFLLFNKKTKELRFYEAKHFTNKEIWSKKGTSPNVTSQIKRYEEQIKEDTSHILDEYKKYAALINDEWGCDLPLPESIAPEVCLYIFGFDANQRDGRMKELLLNDGSLKNIKHYEKGEPSTLVIESLWGSSD